MENFRATFYIGNVFDNSLPIAFQQDVLKTERQVCWFKYNLWQLPGFFQTRFGFRANQIGQNFTTVNYKSEVFNKSWRDTELGIAQILNPSLANSVATACGMGEFGCTPYIVQARNFWYVADIPFSFVTEDDRYVAFADVLHDILRIDHPASHRALIRIEQVNPTTSPATLRQIADFLRSEEVPFAISLTPVFADSQGVFNGGMPRTIAMSDVPDFVDALRFAVDRGGTIVLNGFTHQFEGLSNPFNGATGDDFEFFRVQVDAFGNVVSNEPVPQDSLQWVGNRIESARNELRKAGLQVEVWQTPYNAASPLDYQAFAANFPATMQRVLNLPYALTPRGPGRKGPADTPFFSSQFFPYLIFQDIYGQKVIPENLGAVDPGAPGLFWPVRLPTDLTRTAARNLVVRDGFAGAVFHSFLELDHLKSLVRGLKDLGYTFVSASPDLQ
jgi:uncharacterized protein YdaL